MYSKTNPGATTLSPRRKRALAVTVVFVVLVFGGVGVWAAVAPDALSGSAHGCVNVQIPNSMGGATLHSCGTEAKSLCHEAFELSTPVARYERPACRAAGLAP